jgi:hypothetical protein
MALGRALAPQWAARPHTVRRAAPARRPRLVAAAASPSSQQNGAPARPAVVVSGASSGIGKATAAHLAEKGWRVFAGVRTSEAAAELAKLNPAIEPITLDVTRCGGAGAAGEGGGARLQPHAKAAAAAAARQTTPAAPHLTGPLPCCMRGPLPPTHPPTPQTPRAARTACARRRSACARRSGPTVSKASAITLASGARKQRPRGAAIFAPAAYHLPRPHAPLDPHSPGPPRPLNPAPGPSGPAPPSSPQALASSCRSRPSPSTRGSP